MDEGKVQELDAEDILQSLQACQNDNQVQILRKQRKTREDSL